MTTTIAARPRHATGNPGTDHTRLPLSDMLARIEAAIACHANTVTLPPTLGVDGEHGAALLALLLTAAAHHFDTVRVHTGPHGPVVAVSRRRHRPRRHR
jgi:hypothetical protein